MAALPWRRRWPRRGRHPARTSTAEAEDTAMNTIRILYELTVVLLPLLLAGAAAAGPAGGTAALPERLHDTGLFAPGQPERLGAHVVAFEPQHTLWSDAAAKRRWIRLPPGTAIDARDPDRWRFPPGTRLWKEFSHAGRVETRYIELGADGRWRFATYVWGADGRSARLAPARGVTLAVEGAPEGRYEVPARADCLACHGGARSPVLGFGALQLGPELSAWVRNGRVRHAPAAWREHAPPMPGATEAERAARGYLHANCGHCHHAPGGVPVPLRLAQDVAGNPAPAPEQLQAALRRIATRQPTQQMPPLGTRIPDPKGQALLRAWLAERPLSSNPQPQPERPR
jgi:mono/diheme cytochrome c family protein